MRLIILFFFLVGCAAAPQKPTMASDDAWKAFDEAILEAKGKLARTAMRSGGLDAATARDKVAQRIKDLAQIDDAKVALHLATGFGLEGDERRQVVEWVFSKLLEETFCLRAAQFAKTFELGKAYGERALDCERKASVVKAASVVCVADVSDGYRDALLKAAAAELDAQPVTEALKGVWTLLESNCPMPRDVADRWFAPALAWKETLRSAREILEKATIHKWGWDLQPRYRAFLEAALGFKSYDEVHWVMFEPGFQPGADDYAKVIPYFIGEYRCDDAFALVLKRKLPMAKAEEILAEKRCAGTDFDAGTPDIPKDVADEWQAMVLRHGKFLLGRKICDLLPAPEECATWTETAAINVRDFDSAMRLKPQGESGEHKTERVLGTALGMNEEWFVVRWTIMAARDSNLQKSLRDGWIERAFLHALFRKEWKLAAACIAAHPDAGAAAIGKRLVSEEALLAGDADTAIDLGRRYDLPADFRTRAAKLKAQQAAEAERVKLIERQKAAKKKRLNSADWQP